ncbi:hypothetical protein POTOM_006578 [Populus tomentosa]|uniref:Uncharacterized protein n=1 Tax=Populus tomentosa TaxID=118781 RepID=A0A8X8ANG0_POPTO|nr:hypothetical protein POTOM_006578 [Populus tomentosa]
MIRSLISMMIRDSLSASSFDSENSYRRSRRSRSFALERMRDSSVSSTSTVTELFNLSEYCSQSDESEYERRKGRPEKREDERRKPENIRNEDERRRYWSGSCSSCSRYDGGSDIFMSNTAIGENPSKRPSNDSNYAASNIEANEITESDNVGAGQLPRNKPGYDIDKAAKSAVIQKGKHDGAVEALSPVMPELGQIKSSNSNLTRMAREDFAHSLQNEKIPNGGICGSESSSAKNNVHPPDQASITKCYHHPEETLDSSEANQAKLASGISVATNGAHTGTSPISPIVNGNDASVSTPAEPSACIASSAGDSTLNKSLDEGKEGSQLEQKTTSVTRGGEMVQVNLQGLHS